MRRQVVAGLVGIGALFLGSLVVLDRLSRDVDAPRKPPARYIPPPPPPIDLQIPKDWKPGQLLDPPKPGSLTPADFDKLVERGPARVEPPRESWEAVPIASGRAKGGDPVMATVGRELNDLHELLTTCFDPAVAARHGTSGITEVKGEEQEEDLGTAILVLQLELQRGAVHVVDAPVQVRGGVAEETLACAQAMLRGKTFDTPGTKAGGRRRLQYKLIP